MEGRCEPEFNRKPSITARRRWLLNALGWDGCCPLIVAAPPEAFSLLFPKDLADLAPLVLVLAMMLVRAERGERQIVACTGGRATLGRQFLFVCALVMLLLFEGLSVMLICAPGAPLRFWCWAGLFYLMYLSLVMPALRPA